MPDDIRIVYDATRSRLNKVVWAPWFPMPTVVSHYRPVVADIFMTDCDVGEMFLNFMLEPDLRPYAGADLTYFFSEDISAKDPVIRGWWKRMLMGFSPSTYLFTKDLMVVEQMIRGNRKSWRNIFGWKKVILNLLDKNSYDPSMPWVYKVGLNSEIAADLHFYIDDGRPTAGTAKDNWIFTQRVCQILGYLGIQDACRKRTAPSQESGERTGTSVDSSRGLATMFVSVKKWLRSKEIILWIRK